MTKTVSQRIKRVLAAACAVVMLGTGAPIQQLGDFLGSTIPVVAYAPETTYSIHCDTNVSVENITSIKIDNNDVGLDGLAPGSRVVITSNESLDFKRMNNSHTLVAYTQVGVSSNSEYDEEKGWFVPTYTYTIYSMPSYDLYVQHTHTPMIVYGENNSSLSIGCTQEGAAPALLASIDAPDQVFNNAAYDGSEIVSTYETDYNVQFGEGVTYYQGNNELDGAPTNAGSYTAKYSVTFNEEEYTIEDDFEITPFDITDATLTASNLQFNNAQQWPQVSVQLPTGYNDQGEPIAYETYNMVYRNSDNPNGDYQTDPARVSKVKDYSLTVTGCGNFTGSQSDVTMKVTQKAPLNVTVDNKTIVFGNETPVADTIDDQGSIQSEFVIHHGESNDWSDWAKYRPYVKEVKLRTVVDNEPLLVELSALESVFKWTDAPGEYRRLPAGNYNLVLTVSDLNGNYADQTVPINLTVTKKEIPKSALKLVINAPNTEEDGEDYTAASFTYWPNQQSGVRFAFADDSGMYYQDTPDGLEGFTPYTSGDDYAYTATNAGDYYAVAAVASDSNYSIPANDDGTTSDGENMYKIPWKINPLNINDEAVTVTAADTTFNGQVQFPTITVSVAGVDYTAVFPDDYNMTGYGGNISAGTYNEPIDFTNAAGFENFTDIRLVPWTIKKASPYIANAVPGVAGGNYIYDGDALSKGDFNFTPDSGYEGVYNDLLNNDPSYTDSYGTTRVYVTTDTFNTGSNQNAGRFLRRGVTYKFKDMFNIYHEYGNGDVNIYADDTASTATRTVNYDEAVNSSIVYEITENGQLSINGQTTSLSAKEGSEFFVELAGALYDDSSNATYQSFKIYPKKVSEIKDVKLTMDVNSKYVPDSYAANIYVFNPNFNDFHTTKTVKILPRTVDVTPVSATTEFGTAVANSEIDYTVEEAELDANNKPKGTSGFIASDVVGNYDTISDYVKSKFTGNNALVWAVDYYGAAAAVGTYDYQVGQTYGPDFLDNYQFSLADTTAALTVTQATIKPEWFRVYNIEDSDETKPVEFIFDGTRHKIAVKTTVKAPVNLTDADWKVTTVKWGIYPGTYYVGIEGQGNYTGTILNTPNMTKVIVGEEEQDVDLNATLKWGIKRAKVNVEVTFNADGDYENSYIYSGKPLTVDQAIHTNPQEDALDEPDIAVDIYDGNGVLTKVEPDFEPEISYYPWPFTDVDDETLLLLFNAYREDPEFEPAFAELVEKNGLTNYENFDDFYEAVNCSDSIFVQFQEYLGNRLESAPVDAGEYFAVFKFAVNGIDFDPGVPDNDPDDSDDGSCIIVKYFEIAPKPVDFIVQKPVELVYGDVQVTDNKIDGYVANVTDLYNPESEDYQTIPAAIVNKGFYVFNNTEDPDCVVDENGNHVYKYLAIGGYINPSFDGEEDITNGKYLNAGAYGLDYYNGYEMYELSVVCDPNTEAYRSFTSKETKNYVFANIPVEPEEAEAEEAEEVEPEELEEAEAEEPIIAFTIAPKRIKPEMFKTNDRILSNGWADLSGCVDVADEYADMFRKNADGTYVDFETNAGNTQQTGTNVISVYAYENEDEELGDLTANFTGVCEVDVNVKAPEADERSAVISKVSLDLNECVRINVKLAINDAAMADEGAYVLFTAEDGKTVEIPLTSGKFETSSDLYVFSYDVLPQRFTDNLNVKIYLSDGVITDEANYSVVSYINQAKEKNPNNANLLYLLDAILNYGAANQVYFNYKKDSLPNVGVDQEQFPEALTVDEEYSKVVSETTATGVNDIKLSLDLSEKIILNVKYYMSGNTKDYTVTCRNLTTSEEKTLILKPSSAFNYVQIEGLTPRGFDDMFEITITNNNDSSYSTVTYGVLSHVKMLLETNNNANLRSLVRSIYYYNDAADIYFG